MVLASTRLAADLGVHAGGGETVPAVTLAATRSGSCSAVGIVVRGRYAEFDDFDGKRFAQKTSNRSPTSSDPRTGPASMTSARRRGRGVGWRRARATTHVHGRIDHGGEAASWRAHGQVGLDATCRHETTRSPPKLFRRDRDHVGNNDDLVSDARSIPARAPLTQYVQRTGASASAPHSSPR